MRPVPEELSSFPRQGCRPRPGELLCPALPCPARTAPDGGTARRRHWQCLGAQGCTRIGDSTGGSVYCLCRCRLCSLGHKRWDTPPSPSRCGKQGTRTQVRSVWREEAGRMEVQKVKRMRQKQGLILTHAAGDRAEGGGRRQLSLPHGGRPPPQEGRTGEQEQSEPGTRLPREEKWLSRWRGTL